MARYSDSAEDRDTVVCFLLFHEIKQSPKNRQYPVTDLLVDKHFPQSASTNALNLKDPDLEKEIPLPGDFFRYLKTRKARLR